jgi:hypothetical protein
MHTTISKLVYSTTTEIIKQQNEQGWGFDLYMTQKTNRRGRLVFRRGFEKEE